MPISALDGMPEAHWADVLAIIFDAIDKAGFAPNLVSNADDIGIIQKRIIQNLYDNPIVVCDVSGKNPNVMFELGMRLAFDKPTIIVKDDKTSYSFDTAPIEHLLYPRDLRYASIVEFKGKLAEKIKGTDAKASSDPQYTTFLKNFGEFTVAKLDKKEITGQEYILEELKAMRVAIQRIERPSRVAFREPSFSTVVSGAKAEDVSSLLGEYSMFIRSFRTRETPDEKSLNVTVYLDANAPMEFVDFIRGKLSSLAGGPEATT